MVKKSTKGTGKTSKRKSRTEELLDKVLNHELTPKAEIVPRTEVRDLLRKLNAAPWQLPWIRSTDPLVRGLGAKPGDIIRIIRKSPTAGEIVIYRFVTPG